MWNAGSAPARMIEVISPGRFEHFFRELSDLTAAGPRDMAAIGGLAKACGSARRHGSPTSPRGIS